VLKNWFCFVFLCSSIIDYFSFIITNIRIVSMGFAWVFDHLHLGSCVILVSRPYTFCGKIVDFRRLAE
jgi:hypothetical protein